VTPIPTGRIDRARGGFAVLEVVVALAVGALVLLGARAMYAQLADDAGRIVDAASEADREANADALLRGLVGRAEVEPRLRPFEGEAAGARFWTWCDTPAGWQERCRTTLGILSVDGAPLLALMADGGEVVPLRRDFHSGRLLYLRDASDGGAWARNWSSELSLPLAIGVVLERDAAADTLILRIGERG
jgi:hypothetical protein